MQGRGGSTHLMLSVSSVNMRANRCLGRSPLPWFNTSGCFCITAVTMPRTGFNSLPATRRTAGVGG